jgi:hypothetical protein
MLRFLFDYSLQQHIGKNQEKITIKKFLPYGNILLDNQITLWQDRAESKQQVL